jgi:hypothetical protein
MLKSEYMTSVVDEEMRATNNFLVGLAFVQPNESVNETRIRSTRVTLEK